MKWESKSLDLTPFERRDGIWYKREDYFAPLGINGINGSKLRQCIWIVQQGILKGGKTHLVTGASIRSPQLAMGTLVARHYGLKPVMVIGKTSAKTAIRQESVLTSAWARAKFNIISCPFNPSLQNQVAVFGRDKRVVTLEYGITITTSDRDIEAFHHLGSHQVKNIPDSVDTLVVPAGSCNSCVSIMYGLAMHRPKNLRKVVLMGIGPNKLEFIESRLRACEQESGVPIRHLFRRTYHQNSDMAEQLNGAIETEGADDRFTYDLHHYDLHTTKLVDYLELVPFHRSGIDFHPTYEGKVMNFLHTRPGEFRDFWDTGRSAFWIVGAEVKTESFSAELERAFGPKPTTFETTESIS